MKERNSKPLEVKGGKNNWSKIIYTAIGCTVLMTSVIGCSSSPLSSSPTPSSPSTASSTENKANTESIETSSHSASQDTKPELKDFNDYLKNAGINFNDVESLKKEMAIPLFAPAELPEGYKPTTIKKLNDRAFLIHYEHPKKDLLFLAQDGGEYNFTDPTQSYDVNEEKKINGYEVSLLGTKEHESEYKYHLISWEINGISYSMECDSALSLTQVETILKSLKEVK